MGNQIPQITYSVEVSEKKEGETSVRRTPIAADGLKIIPDPDIITMQDAWLRSVKRNGN